MIYLIIILVALTCSIALFSLNYIPVFEAYVMRAYSYTFQYNIASFFDAGNSYAAYSLIIYIISLSLIALTMTLVPFTFIRRFLRVDKFKRIQLGLTAAALGLSILPMIFTLVFRGEYWYSGLASASGDAYLVYRYEIGGYWALLAVEITEVIILACAFALCLIGNFASVGQRKKAFALSLASFEKHETQSVKTTNNIPIPSENTAVNGPNIPDKIKQYYELYLHGAITEEEYNELKRHAFDNI